MAAWHSVRALLEVGEICTRTGQVRHLVMALSPQDWDEELLALIWGVGGVNMSDSV